MITLHTATHPRPAFHCFASLSPLASERSAGIAMTLTSSTILPNASMSMEKKLFKRLVDSMGQMEEIVRGMRAPSREFYVGAAKVKEFRAVTGLSQPRFAKLLHGDVGTSRNWEQGRREPTVPAKALLRAIQSNPKAVLKALSA